MTNRAIDPEEKLAMVRKQLHLEHTAAVEAGDTEAEERAAALIFIVARGRHPQEAPHRFQAYMEGLHEGAQEELQARAEEYADSLEDFDPHEY